MKQLYRNSKNGIICGVCQGIGEYFEIDPTLVRVFWVLVTIFSGVFPGIVFYFILCLIVPEKKIEETKTEDQEKENTEQKKENSCCSEFEQSENQDSCKKDCCANSFFSSKPYFVFGLILIFFGLIFLLKNFSLVWFDFSEFWPLILILIGCIFLYKNLKR